MSKNGTRHTACGNVHNAAILENRLTVCQKVTVTIGSSSSIPRFKPKVIKNMLTQKLVHERS